MKCKNCNKPQVHEAGFISDFVIPLCENHMKEYREFYRKICEQR